MIRAHQCESFFMNAANPPDHLMQCMEVWGGNRIVDDSVKVAGLAAWVYSKAFGGSEGGS